MKKSLIRNLTVFSLIVFAWMASVESVLGCRMFMMPEKPRSSVHKDLFIFVGEVIGYTDPVTDPNNFRGSATGLKLKVVEAINVRHFTADHIELFMFGHGTDCFPEASPSKPSIGTRFRVSLGPATLVANRSASNIRLESKFGSRITSGDPMFGYSTTVKFVFDYRTELAPLAAKFDAPEMADKRAWLEDFLHVETSKDLIRLYDAKTEKARMDILERLLYCPNIHYAALLNSKIGRLTETIDMPERPMRVTWDNRFILGKDKLTRRETQLLNERTRLEQTGELNYRKNWKNAAN